MKLEQLFQEFGELEPRERLELLIEFSETLSELSDERASTPVPAECRVVECQTPVDLWVDVVEGAVHVEALVPRQSPMVRGLVALLIEGIDGAPPADVLAMPDDILVPLNLAEVLGMVRQRGARGLVANIKRRIVSATSA